MIRFLDRVVTVLIWCIVVCVIIQFRLSGKKSGALRRAHRVERMLRF